MNVLIFIGILIVLGIIGAALDPVIKKHERARIASLQRNLPPGRVVCPSCKGTKRVWNGGGGNLNSIGAPSGRSERCPHCWGGGSVRYQRRQPKRRAISSRGLDRAA